MSDVEESIRAKDVNNLGLYEAHKFSSNHREYVEIGICGCFYCERIFDVSETPIKEWTDKGTTAHCPFCGIDSVLPGACLPQATDPKFLSAMHDAWFSPSED